MALSWIRVDNDLPDHPKSLALDVALGVDRSWTHVVQLWLWTSRVVPTGDLSKMPDAVIASRAGWKKDASVFVDALRHIGFLDSDGMLHDWHEYQGKMLERLEKDRERKRKPPKDSTGTPAELHRKSDGSPTEVQRTSTGNPLLRNETVRDGTVRDETHEETAPTADAAVPAPERKPKQESLLALPDKAEKATRKATPEQEQADAWRAKALSIAGIKPEDAGPWPKGIFHQWRREAKGRGVDTLMRALDGIARLPPTDFTRKRGWVHWLAGEGIDAGLAALTAPIASTGTRGASNAIPKTPPVEFTVVPPPKPWSAEDELAACKFFTSMRGGAPRKFRLPENRTLPDGFVIPEEHLPIQAAPAVNA